MLRSPFFLSAILVIAASALSACSGTSSATNEGANLVVPSAASYGHLANSPLTTIGGLLHSTPPNTPAHGWLSREARGKELLYVADDGNNTITIYQAVGKNQAPVGQITRGIDGPEGLAFANRHLYVTNTGNNTVTVYRLGHVTPSKTYSQDLAAPAGVAVGDDGTVYVTNLDGSDSVVAYAKGSTTPTRIYQGLELPIAPALDRENDLYVTYISGVEEYPPASTNGRNLGLDISNLGGIAIDASDNLVVAQQISPPEIKVFPQGATEPSKVFGQEDDPNPLTFLKSEKKIFVGEPLSNVVNVYAYPGGKSINAISNEVNLPQGLAVSPSAPL